MLWNYSSAMNWNNWTMRKLRRLLLLLFIGMCLKPVYAETVNRSVQPDFFIVDSWLTGFFGGLFRKGDKHLKSAWKEANHRAGVDAKIWGGLFVSDTSRSGMYRFGEIISRVTYQLPQTVSGNLTAHFYNTVLGKVQTVEYGGGAAVISMRVDWLGVTLGTYILGDSTLHAVPDNRLYQHEYGHYLQSKRMGLAYFVRVGLPAIMSKGNHDAHPVEVDCNREAFLYFNRLNADFQQDSLLNDAKGWNFRFNPFPDSVGNGKKNGIVYVDYNDTIQREKLHDLKVHARFFDYASWCVPVVLPVISGMITARNYNKKQLEKEQ